MNIGIICIALLPTGEVINLDKLSTIKGNQANVAIHAETYTSIKINKGDAEKFFTEFNERVKCVKGSK